MGTGSTRKSSRYRDYLNTNRTIASGDWSGYSAATPYDYGNSEQTLPPTPQEIAAMSQAGGIDPRRIQPNGKVGPAPNSAQVRVSRGGMFSVANTPNMTPEERLAAADAAQQAQIDAAHRRQYYEELDKNRGPSQEANAEYARRHGNKDKKHLTPEEQANLWFEQHYYDPSADIRKSYAAQEAAINAQYDQMLARMGREHGAAERGVRQEGQQLQKDLTAIGADAAANLAASNRQIDKDYAKALKGVNADYGAAARDIKGQGGRTSDIAVSRADARSDLREGHVADAALGQRYQSMLSQEINNRQATGATVTVAGINDLARVLQESRDNASSERLAAVAKVEANMAGDLAQAKSQKAQAKYSMFLDVLKGGGTLGEAGLKVATPGTINSAIKTIQDGQIDYSKTFSGLTKSKDPDEIAMGQQYEEKLLNHTLTPQQVWAEWQANPHRNDMPYLGEAIMQLVGYAQALQVDPKTLTKYLNSTGYKTK